MGSISYFLSFKGDPHYRQVEDKNGINAQSFGTQSDHGHGRGCARTSSANHQRGSDRLSNVCNTGQHGSQYHLL